MKKVKLLSLSLVLFIFTMGCSSDDDSNNPQTVEQMLMSGKWFLEKINGEEIHPCRKSTFMHFYDENKFTYAFYQESSDGSDCYLEYTEQGIFVLISDMFIEVNVSDSNFDNHYEIISISQEELIITEQDLILTFDKTEG